MKESAIYFPVNQREQAAQLSADNLLAKTIFRDLITFLNESIENRAILNEFDNDDIDNQRSHNAILIDGERGTGKSSILVNLPLYIGDVDKELYGKLLILKPVDPTLLESSDDLFLNVIVAAIIRDQQVAEAIDLADEKSEAFHHQLQMLGNALESLQLQNEHYGLDKLRAFLGNHGLMQQVHLLFKKTLELVGKELLVLPIDDVDTSLSQAFENLEVVRKYLTSPYVLPIISGDLSLYHEVTWRDFHARLNKDSNVNSESSIFRSKDLAYEYERKVLPLQYRKTMPSVNSYMQQRDIILRSNNNDHLSMYTFVSWLEALLNERINGFENSHLELPIKTVRELSQLVYTFKEHIPSLGVELKKIGIEDPSASMIRRITFMPMNVSSALKLFRREYNEAQSQENKSKRESGRNVSYTNFFNNVENSESSNNKEIQDLVNSSKLTLIEHMKYDYKGGKVYLSLTADSYFENQKKINTAEWKSVFDTYLFQPLTHEHKSLKAFHQEKSIESWVEFFHGRVPQSWLNNLPECTIISYPTPEAGYATTLRANNLNSEEQFLIDFILHRNFYSINKRADLICCGRIFELVITSLIKDIKNVDVAHILQRAPFYSFSSIAGTKALVIGDDSEQENGLELNLTNDDSDNSECINKLVTDINLWREKHRLEGSSTSAWLVYNVMNKFYSQVGIFNQPLTTNKSPRNDGVKYIFNVARKAYRSLWAAFGSFEKGSVFGLPMLIASVNIRDGDDFERNELYLQNILPFLRKSDSDDNICFGDLVMSYTFALSDHPLKKLIENAYLNAPEQEQSNPVNKSKKSKRKES